MIFEPGIVITQSVVESLLLALWSGRFAAVLNHLLQFRFTNHRPRADFSTLQFSSTEPSANCPDTDFTQPLSCFFDGKKIIQSNLQTEIV